MKNKRLITLAMLLAVIMMVSAFGGCSKPAGGDSTPAPTNAPAVSPGNEPSAPPAAESKKDTIVIALNADPGTMNPYEGSFGPQLVLTTQAIESLFIYDANGNLTPCLVKDYKYDDGNTGITLYLRDDVYFHNGDKMTSEDVVYSFSAVKNSKGASAILTAIDLDNVKAVDEYTVYVPAKFPCGTMTHLLTNLFVVSKNTYESDAASGAGFNGTGPWKVTDWQAGVSVSFDAFDKYWGGMPKIKHLIMRIITESSVRMIELENGTVDMYKGAAAEDIARVLRGESPNISIWKANASQTIFYLGFNCSHEPFNNPQVRKAFCYALDRESIVAAVFEGKGEVSTSLLPGGMWYSPTLPDELLYKYDPAKAKALLAEAGYTNGIEVSLYVDSVQSRRAMAELIPAMMAEAGITVNIEFMETAAFNEYMLNQNDYDMFLWNFGNLFEPSGALSTIRVENNKLGGSGKWHYYDDPAAAEIDALLKKAQSIADDKERAAVYYDLAKLWAENAYSCSIVDQYDVNLVASNLKGMFYSPNINVQNAYFE